MNQLNQIKRRKTITSTLRRFASSKKLSAIIAKQLAEQKTDSAIAFFKAIKQYTSIKLAQKPYDPTFQYIGKNPHSGPRACVVIGPDELMCGGLLHTLAHAWNQDSFYSTHIFGKQMARHLHRECFSPTVGSFQTYLDLSRTLLQNVSEDRISNICIIYTNNGVLRMRDVFPFFKITSLNESISQKESVLLLAALMNLISNDMRRQENFQRLISADQSVKSCDDLLDQLSLKARKVRQADITKGLCELFGARVLDN